MSTSPFNEYCILSNQLQPTFANRMTLKYILLNNSFLRPVIFDIKSVKVNSKICAVGTRGIDVKIHRGNLCRITAKL